MFSSYLVQGLRLRIPVHGILAHLALKLVNDIAHDAGAAEILNQFLPCRGLFPVHLSPDGIPLHLTGLEGHREGMSKTLRKRPFKALSHVIGRQRG